MKWKRRLGGIVTWVAIILMLGGIFSSSVSTVVVGMVCVCIGIVLYR